VGHASQHADSVTAQVDEIVANLGSLLQGAHAQSPVLPATFGRGSLFKVYLRNRVDLQVVEDRLRTLLPDSASWLVLQGEVCRSVMAVRRKGTATTVARCKASATRAWGTSPGMVVPVTGSVPDPSSASSEADRAASKRALEYMQLEPRVRIQDIEIDRVFIGSCTNARIEDLRAAARVVKGYKIRNSVSAMVVPGSQAVKRAAEDEGLDQVFRESGFEWREAGCSMCLGMNADTLQPGERCASTSNRNFEGRQGRGGLTHLVSPMMAAAAAITGRFTDVREWKFK